MNASKPEKKDKGGCSPALTTKQVCEILGINRKTLYKMIANGEIPGVKSGKGYKVSPDAVRNHLKGKRSKKK